MKKFFHATVALAALAPAAAMAGDGVQTGTYNGFEWTAQSTIIGQNSTGTVPAGGGNPDYLAHDNPAYRGVVQLRMSYGAAGAFSCSGALMSDGRVLTAAHCISTGYNSNVDGRAAGLLSTTAYFYTGNLASNDPLMQNGGVAQAGVTAVAVSSYSTHFGYTGEVIDQNDIAVLTLAGGAPAGITGYDLYNTSSLNGLTFNVAGYGLRSVVGGDVGYGGGAAAGTGRLREGNNTYDLRLGEFYSSLGGGRTAEFEFSYLSDFDKTNTPANNSGCILFGRCNAGLGAREVNIASGDSGGPAFVNGQIASVNSYALTFGLGSGDTFCDPPVPPATRPSCLNGSFGEFAGYVPTFIHADWIAGVPEPSAWALLIMGFGVAGASMRRKTRVTARYAAA